MITPQFEHKLYLGQNSPSGVIADSTVDNWLKLNCPTQGYTVYHANGVWQGDSEPSTIVVVNGPESLKTPLHGLALAYDRDFNQQAVYYTRLPIHGELISLESQSVAA